MNPIQLAVEGLLDAVVAARLTEVCGFDPQPPNVKGGKGNLDKLVAAYNNAAKGSPWLVLRDLDRDADCAGVLRKKLIPAPQEWMCFRIPVRAVESWLMADRPRFAAFARISLGKVPVDPDALPNPKQTLLDLVSHSPSRDLRESVVPRKGSGGREGPLYTSVLSKFALTNWRPNMAEANSESLRRCLIQLRRTSARWRRYIVHGDAFDR